MRWRHRVECLLSVCLALPAWAQDKPVSLEDFVSPGVITSMKISPDGKWVAGIGSTRTTAVFLTELDTSRTIIVALKVADPERICIYGASYGGYAALWGVIKTPQLYKCSISFAGVSDLNEMLSHSIFDDPTPASRGQSV